MMPNEQLVLESIRTPHNKHAFPCAWAAKIAYRARSERKIRDDYALSTIMEEIELFRLGLCTLFQYDWVGVPMVYTQVG